MVTCTQVTKTFHAHKLKPDLLGISTQNIYNQTSDELFKTIVGEYSIGILLRARYYYYQFYRLLLNTLGTCRGVRHVLPRFKIRRILPKIRDSTTDFGI